MFLKVADMKDIFLIFLHIFHCKIEPLDMPNSVAIYS